MKTFLKKELILDEELEQVVGGINDHASDNAFLGDENSAVADLHQNPIAEDHEGEGIVVGGTTDISCGGTGTLCKSQK